MTGTKDTPAAAFHTLAFILRLHPDTIITPESISKQLEIRSTVVGGKFKKPGTIKHEFRQLCNAGYMFRKFNSDSKGGSMPTEYGINFVKIYGGGGENSTPTKSCAKDTKSKQKNQQEGGGENSIPPLYKERASSNTDNTGKDSIQNLFSSDTEKNPPPTREDFFASVPSNLRDKETRKMINCLIKAFEDDYFKAYDFMTSVFVDEKVDDPIRYVWGAIKKRNKKLVDTQPQQYQTRPQSEQAPPAKPQNDMAEQDGKQIVQQFADIDSKFESFIKNLSTKEQIELIDKIKPNLSQFTIRRLGIQNNISKDLLEYYFINYQVRSEIVAYYELL